MIVVDTNVLLYHFLESENNALTRRLAVIDPAWVTVRLWQYEFLNALALAVRQRGLTLEEALAVWHEAFRHVQKREMPVDTEKVLRLSVQVRISAYDAQFIMLAIDLGVPCVTEDQELLRKFPGRAIGLAGFIAGHPPTDGVAEASPPYGMATAKRPVRRGK